MVGRLGGRSVGRSIGWSVGWSVGRSIRLLDEEPLTGKVGANESERRTKGVKGF